MKTTALCPISDRKIDNHVARFNGAFTLLFLAAYFFTGSIFPVLFLLIDFSLRSGRGSRYSAFSFLSRQLVKLFSLKPEPINAGPKIFAARVGLAFTIGIIVSWLAGSPLSGYAFAAVFGTCALLESVFNICVACQIYPFVYKLFYHHSVQHLEA